MPYLSIWISVHRGLLIGMVGALLWIAANYWYFRRDIARIKRENRPHRWTVDMAAKTGTGGKRQVR